MSNLNPNSLPATGGRRAAAIAARHPSLPFAGLAKSERSSARGKAQGQDFHLRPHRFMIMIASAALLAGLMLQAFGGVG